MSRPRRARGRGQLHSAAHHRAAGSFAREKSTNRFFVNLDLLFLAMTARCMAA